MFEWILDGMCLNGPNFHGWGTKLNLWHRHSGLLHIVSDPQYREKMLISLKWLLKICSMFNFRHLLNSIVSMFHLDFSVDARIQINDSFLKQFGAILFWQYNNHWIIKQLTTLRYSENYIQTDHWTIRPMNH